jgi:hypothetical protein
MIVESAPGKISLSGDVVGGRLVGAPGMAIESSILTPLFANSLSPLHSLFSQLPLASPVTVHSIVFFRICRIATPASTVQAIVPPPSTGRSPPASGRQ